jgi:NAD(P)-dependent dehydrogenase (short-subunit alcohol dehydrogenase family)
MRDYSGRTVVITGAGSGLGSAMADRFAAAGANLVLLDIDEERVLAKGSELTASGVAVLARPLDVADKAQLTAAASAIEERFGGIHVVCANVGVQQFGAIDRLSDDDWTWVMGVNFHGAVGTIDALLPLLRSAEGARHIVLTASASVFQFGARMAAYVASKFAVVGYGEVLRQELADEGINVAMLFPAGMATRHLESSVAARPSTLGESRLDFSDIEAMMASAGITGEEHVASADHAVRNLLADLEAGHRYIITHGDYRGQVESQQAEVLAAFDRMQAG